MTVPSRREFITTLAVAAGVTVAGCMGGDDDDGDDDAPSTPDDDDTDPDQDQTDDDAISDDVAEDEWASVSPYIEHTMQQFAGDPWNMGWVATGAISDPEEIWTYTAPDGESFATATGAVANDTVCYVTSDGYLRGVSIDEGDEIMVAPLGFWYGRTPSPVATTGDVTVTGEIDAPDYDTYMAQVNTDGEEQWSVNFVESPAGEFSGDLELFVQGGDGDRVYAYSAQEPGIEEWSATVSDTGGGTGTDADDDGDESDDSDDSDTDDGDGESENGGEAASLSTSNSIIGAPAIGDAYVFVMTPTAVHCLSKSSGAVQWSEDVPESSIGTPVLYGDLLVVPSDGELTVFESATGDEVWSGAYGDTYGGVAVGDDYVVVADVSTDTVAAIDVFEATGEWETELNEEITGRPCIVDDAVYLPTMEGVVAVDLESGAVEWVHRTDEPVSGELLVADGVLIARSDETLYALTESA